jgi:hypothetical protein
MLTFFIYVLMISVQEFNLPHNLRSALDSPSIFEIPTFCRQENTKPISEGPIFYYFFCLDFISLFIYLFIYLFIFLFIYLFIYFLSLILLIFSFIVFV